MEIKKGIRKGHYFVTSDSDENKVYEVDVINGEHSECLGFFHRKTCKHWEACKKLYEEEYKLSKELLEEMKHMSGKSIASWTDTFTSEQIDDAITQGYIIIHNGKVLFL